MEADYKVKLDVFEGPLDLLLYLIKQDEIDIYDISLERITGQYLEYLQAFKELNIELAVEFIVVKTHFMYGTRRRRLLLVWGLCDYLVDPQAVRVLSAKSVS